MPELTMLLALAETWRVSTDAILRPEAEANSITGFMCRNLAAPAQKLLATVPKISRWEPPEGCDMFYSLPAMIAEALYCLEAQEAGRAAPPSMKELNGRFYELMHVMGIGYGFLWRGRRNLIEELWHINAPEEMIGRAMGYYGRDYLWLTRENAAPDEMRRLLIWSIDRGRPVVMEWAGGIPEYSIVTGYEDKGNILIGWTYCPECAAKTNERGMFVNPARWQEDFAFHMLVIGDEREKTVTDRDTVAYALEVLDRRTPGDGCLTDTLAGDAALQEWRLSCGTPEGAARHFSITDIYTHALYQNSIYTQKCLRFYYKGLGERSSRKIYDIVNQIGIAVDILEEDRRVADACREEPAAYADACRKHIGKLLEYRCFLRGWLEELLPLL